MRRQVRLERRDEWDPQLRSVPHESEPEKKQRRALSTVGGFVEAQGDPDACDRLRTAMAVNPDEEDSRAHVHGFHSYPARLHPVMARRLIELFAPPHGRVFDPFCGSGTVLIESRLAGRAAQGVDLNPLAVALSRSKVRGASRHELDQLVDAAREVALYAEERRKQRLGATRRYPEADTELFDPHVLLELDGLRDGLQQLTSGGISQMLQLVLSSILTKVSRKRGDTGELVEEPRRLATGYTVRLFDRKAEELAQRIDDYSRMLPHPLPPVDIECEDARECRSLKPSTVDLVLTSPPYPGTYDYVAHHETRLRWLGMRSDELDRGEIGSRRRAEDAGWEPARRWFEKDMVRVLQACARGMRPGARAILVAADGVVQGRAMRVDDLMLEALQQAGLRWVATGSQRRPNRFKPAAGAFTASARKEHVIVAEKSGG